MSCCLGAAEPHSSFEITVLMFHLQYVTMVASMAQHLNNLIPTSLPFSVMLNDVSSSVLLCLLGWHRVQSLAPSFFPPPFAVTWRDHNSESPFLSLLRRLSLDLRMFKAW